MSNDKPLDELKPAEIKEAIPKVIAGSKAHFESYHIATQENAADSEDARERLIAQMDEAGL